MLITYFTDMHLCIAGNFQTLYAKPIPKLVKYLIQIIMSNMSISLAGKKN